MYLTSTRWRISVMMVFGCPSLRPGSIYTTILSPLWVSLSKVHTEKGEIHMSFFPRWKRCLYAYYGLKFCCYSITDKITFIHSYAFPTIGMLGSYIISLMGCCIGISYSYYLLSAFLSLLGLWGTYKVIDYPN